MGQRNTFKVQAVLKSALGFHLILSCLLFACMQLSVGHELADHDYSLSLLELFTLLAHRPPRASLTLAAQLGMCATLQFKLSDLPLIPAAKPPGLVVCPALQNLSTC